jgi:anthranilate phosphoribosyltransferase
VNGEKDEAGRRAVLLNAAAALYVAGLAPDYAEAVQLASRTLHSGGAAKVLGELRAAAPR